MRKLICTILAGILSFYTMQAQENDPARGNAKINGIVTDSATGAPLEYATITVTATGAAKPLNGATSGKSGKFSVTGMMPGSYKLLIEYIGYKAFTIPQIVISKNNETVTIPAIVLKKAQESLEAVTVTARSRLIENKIDKMVFNAEKDLTSQGGVATDLLKKIPQVSVDVDGNVQLAGSAGIRFLINGKPSTAFGKSMADVLQSIPASQIKSIEVITNPGAKYDAQGMGGIINIILKQNTARGINGNISLTTGTRAQNGSFNFNARKDNFGVTAFVSGHARMPVTTSSHSLRTSVDTSAKTNSFLEQDGSSRFKRHGIETGIGFDWTIRKYNSITGSVNYDEFGNSNKGVVEQWQNTKDMNGNTLSGKSTLNNSNSKSRSHNIDASLTYKRTFSKEDQELEISVNSSFNNATLTTGNEQLLRPKDSLFYGIRNRNPGREHETQVAIDYTQPLANDIKLGFGAKTTFLDISSHNTVYGFSPADRNYKFDSALSNALNYHQKVYAVYAETSFPAGDLFDVKAGSRYERTETNSFYSNAQEQVKMPGYNTLVPSLFLSRKLGKRQLIKLSYSKRIERPDYEDLNPFINTSDPNNISAGNPYLQPELGQRIELGYSRDIGNLGSLMVTAFYRHNSQDIQPYTKFYPMLKVGDSVYYNVSVSTRENIGTENNTGLNIFTDLHPTGKLALRTNLFFFHRHIINAVDKGADRTSFNYRVNLNATYQFSSTLAAEFFGNFNSPRNEVQGRYPSFTSYSIAMRKQFWNKKASIALTATNPFNEYVNQRLELFGTNFTQNSLRKIPFRSFGINFTWKFGKLEFKKENEERNNDANMAP